MYIMTYIIYIGYKISYIKYLKLYRGQLMKNLYLLISEVTSTS